MPPSWRLKSVPKEPEPDESELERREDDIIAIIFNYSHWDRGLGSPERRIYGKGAREW